MATATGSRGKVQACDRLDSVAGTLDEVDRLHRARLDADAGLFELAAHFADLQGSPSRFGSGRGRVLPGTERAVQVGGAGTPRVSEFAAAELGARMGLGSWSARHYLADALDTRHRLPLTWQHVVDRRARIGYVRHLAARTRHLDERAAASVDAAMADFVDGSLPWGRFSARLEARIVAADPAAAAQREAARVTKQFAKRTRSSEHGTAGFYVRSTVGVIARLEATVAYVAEALAAFGDRDDLEHRRVKAVLLLANPARAVELLASYAALRSRTAGAGVDDGLPLPEPDPGTDPEPGPAPDRGPASVGVPEPEIDPLTRMDRFAARVGFAPNRLPACLPDGGPTLEGGEDVEPTFVFDWSQLLPPLTLYLHLAPDGPHPRADHRISRRVAAQHRPPPPEQADQGRPGCRPHDPDPASGGRGHDPALRADEPGSVRWPSRRHAARGRRQADLASRQRGGSSGVSRTGSAPGSGRSETAASGGVVRWEGESPITEQFVHDHLRPLHRFVIQPVIDLAHQQPVDAYEIPDRHRAAVHLRTPADAFPYSSNTSRNVDIDHVDPYPHRPAGPAVPGADGGAHDSGPDGTFSGGPDGTSGGTSGPTPGSTPGGERWPSRLENYAPLGRFHHRIKTHGHWTLRQPFNGVMVWRDPHGQIYLVDHTGTHRVTGPGAGADTGETEGIGVVGRQGPDAHPGNHACERLNRAIASYDAELHVYPARTPIELHLDDAG